MINFIIKKIIENFSHFTEYIILKYIVIFYELYLIIV